MVRRFFNAVVAVKALFHLCNAEKKLIDSIETKMFTQKPYKVEICLIVIFDNNYSFHVLLVV